MKKILVVEDNELNMKLFFDILQYQKYNVTKAFDGVEAFEKVKEQSFDLIILDIQLPKMNGFEFLQKCNEEKIKLPKIIIVSACAMDSDKKIASGFGIEDYVTKPIDINNFIKVVKRNLEEN